MNGHGRPNLHVVPSVNDPTPIGLAGLLAEIWAQVAVGHATAAAISAALDLDHSQVDRYIAQLVHAGHVRPVDGARGRYEITN